MFTGIVEALGKLEEVSKKEGNKLFRISSPLAGELKVDQSLAHNGICLTVEKIEGGVYQVTAVAETLAKTNADDWQPGDPLNLERAMLMNGRLDGHLVQGHVDAVGDCESVSDEKGSWLYRFRYPSTFRHLVIEKGSIAVNGVSLTAYGVTDTHFQVSIIPFTYEHTNLNRVAPGTRVNLEFDMVGKYISRMMPGR